MSDDHPNLVLELLRGLRTTLERVERRMTTMAGDIASLRQDAARDSMNRSHAEERVDALEDRLARVKARLGIGD